MFDRKEEKAIVAGVLIVGMGIGYLLKGTPSPPLTLKSVNPISQSLQGSREPSAGDEITVHVAGHVKSPGIYELRAGSRIQDAIQSAGGPLADADVESINLAQRVEDGVQIRVEKKGSTPVAALSAPLQSSVSVGSSSSGSKSSVGRPAPGSISLNNASAAELDQLPGVGPATAAKIIEYRNAHGGFSSIDELQAVKGIGPKKLEDMRPYLRL